MDAVKTDHSETISMLRRIVTLARPGSLDAVSRAVAADLLEMHDNQSLSLDNWKAAREFVQWFTEKPIEENHA